MEPPRAVEPPARVLERDFELEVEAERGIDVPAGPPRKPEILGLWNEPGTKRSRWWLWAGVLVLVGIGAWFALQETPGELVPIDQTHEIAEVPADSATQAAPSDVPGAGGTLRGSPAGQTVAQLQIIPSEARIAPGATVGMKAIAMGSGGKPVTGRPIDWRSDAPNVAAVSRTGVVTAVAPGGAIVTATSDGRSASAMVTVTWRGGGVASLVVQPADVNIAVRQTARLSAIARDANGNVLVLRGVEWSSSAPLTAAVSPTGIVTGLAPGTARISVTSDGLPGAPATVTVRAPGPIVATPGGLKPVPPVTSPLVTVKPAAPVAAAPIAVRPPAPMAPRPPVRAGPVAPGVLQMLVTPWAYVSIDGRGGRQRARGVDTLSAGVPHRLRFTREGFATFDTIVTLRPGEQRVLEVQMTPRRP